MHTLLEPEPVARRRVRSPRAGGDLRRQGRIGGSSDLRTCWPSRPRTVTATCRRATRKIRRWPSGSSTAAVSGSRGFWMRIGSRGWTRSVSPGLCGRGGSCAGLGCHGGPVGSVPSRPRALQRPERMAAQSRVGGVVAWGSLQQAVGPARRGTRAAVGCPGRCLGAPANAVGESVRGLGRVPPASWRLQRALRLAGEPRAGQVGEGDAGCAEAGRPGLRAHPAARRDRFRLGSRRRVPLGRDVRRTGRLPARPRPLSDLHRYRKIAGRWATGCIRSGRLRKQGQLDQERIARLDAIGFTWDLRRERWDAMFAALDDFRRATGHCDVPQSWAENRKLGNWVMMQRTAYKAGRLDGQQLERLQAIGFRFSIVGDRILVARPAKTRPALSPASGGGLGSVQNQVSPFAPRKRRNFRGAKGDNRWASQPGKRAKGEQSLSGPGPGARRVGDRVHGFGHSAALLHGADFPDMAFVVQPQMVRVGMAGNL